MRRFFNALAVTALVVSLSVPAYAAPSRDDGGSGDYFPTFIRQIVKLVKRTIHVLDGGDMSIPKP